jgi:hypothetical protein
LAGAITAPSFMRECIDKEAGLKETVARIEAQLRR